VPRRKVTLAVSRRAILVALRTYASLHGQPKEKKLFAPEFRSTICVGKSYAAMRIKLVTVSATRGRFPKNTIRQNGWRESEQDNAAFA